MISRAVDFAKNQAKKKKTKAHQDIYLVLLFASESGSLRYTLYVNFLIVCVL